MYLISSSSYQWKEWTMNNVFIVNKSDLISGTQDSWLCRLSIDGRFIAFQGLLLSSVMGLQNFQWENKLKHIINTVSLSSDINCIYFVFNIAPWRKELLWGLKMYTTRKSTKHIYIFDLSGNWDWRPLEIFQEKEASARS